MKQTIYLPGKPLEGALRPSIHRQTAGSLLKSPHSGYEGAEKTRSPAACLAP